MDGVYVWIEIVTKTERMLSSARTSELDGVTITVIQRVVTTDQFPCKAIKLHLMKATSANFLSCELEDISESLSFEPFKTSATCQPFNNMNSLKKTSFLNIYFFYWWLIKYFKIIFPKRNYEFNLLETKCSGTDRWERSDSTIKNHLRNGRGSSCVRDSNKCDISISYKTSKEHGSTVFVVVF